jgi:glutathione S-transferase
MIKLYGVPGSRAMRALWMLEELGVPYENVPVDFVSGTKQAEFKRLNPNGHIPVLEDGDLVLFESLAINLYLARKYDKGLWPTTVENEGRAYQWSLWARLRPRSR